VDAELLDRVWRDYAVDVYAYARRRVSAAAADDIVVEVFVVALRHPHRLPEEPLAYLYAIAWRVVANHYRRERRRPLELDAKHEPQAVDAYAAVAVRTDVEIALDRLSEREAEAIRLVGFEGLCPVEAARVLRCSPSAFRVTLSRARRHLGEILKEDQNE